MGQKLMGAGLPLGQREPAWGSQKATSSLRLFASIFSSVPSQDSMVVIKTSKCQNKKDGCDGNDASLEAVPLGVAM